MQLAELQRAFQEHVLRQEQSIAGTVVDSAQLPVALRLGIYTDAYLLRLIEALAHNYPRLQQLLGTEAFAQLAQRYLAARPSTYVSVRWLGDRLAEQLEQEADYMDRPWIAELARWEWAVAGAFDAADVEPLGLDALGAIEPGDWPGLYFKFHPSLHRVRLHTNAPALCRALVEGGATPTPTILNTTQDWLIWRQHLTTRFRQLDAAETRALETLQGRPPQGVPGTFAEMCAVLCDFHDPQQVPLLAAGMLKAWIAEGAIVAALKS